MGLLYLFLPSFLHHIQTFRSHPREHINKNLQMLYRVFPGGGDCVCILPFRPDNRWVPHSHTYNGYWDSFTRVKRPRRGIYFPPRPAPGFRLVTTKPVLALCTFMTCCRENLKEITVSYYEIKENISNSCGQNSGFLTLNVEVIY